MFEFNEVQLSIIVITLVLSFLIIFLGKRVSKLSVTSNPKGFLQVGILYVEMINNVIVTNMGKKHGPKFSAYLGSVFIYMLLANTAGLFGLESPTSSLSVTLIFAIITWVLIQAANISTNGWKGYFKGFFDPFVPFVIPNVFGALAPLISLSMRLFGNVLSGGIIMSMLYAFTAGISAYIPLIGGFNVFGVVIAPVIHLYFDLFSGFLQAFVFMTLTTILISVEYSE
ncbi:MAG: F0F1 ATP synthase subunit A [Erysipelothrix sp.]|nr:F0F1 ATP synthase subunit A [Erysipelothrix sp.]